ncbi:hypothetical protein ACXWR7_10215, partial [Streptococcus pyogenes]
LPFSEDTIPPAISLLFFPSFLSPPPSFSSSFLPPLPFPLSPSFFFSFLPSFLLFSFSFSPFPPSPPFFFSPFFPPLPSPSSFLFSFPFLFSSPSP